LVPLGLALLFGVGLAGDAKPRLLPLLARNALQFRGELLVRPFLRDLLQMVAPVEDDEVADQAVDMPDPVAHLPALVRRARPQRRIGKALVQIFADRAA